MKAKHDMYTTFLKDSDKDVVPALRKVEEALEASLAGCKVANDKYLEYLSREAASKEVGWILVVQKRYNQLNQSLPIRQR